jgi:hypothetical protein
MSARRALVWRRLIWAEPIQPATAIAAVRALATLVGQPRVVLEATGSGGGVSWRIGADETALPRVVAALAAHTTGLISETTAINRSVGAAASLRAAGRSGLPLASSQVEPVTRSVLAALAATGRDESVTLQVILGARSSPRVVGRDVEVATKRGVQTKLNEHRFGCEIRIGADAASMSRERMLVGDVLAGLRGLEAPGVRLHLRRTSVGRFNAAGSPLWWSLWPVSASSQPCWPGLSPATLRRSYRVCRRPIPGGSQFLFTCGVTVARWVHRPRTGRRSRSRHRTACDTYMSLDQRAWASRRCWLDSRCRTWPLVRAWWSSIRREILSKTCWPACQSIASTMWLSWIPRVIPRPASVRWRLEAARKPTCWLSTYSAFSIPCTPTHGDRGRRTSCTPAYWRWRDDRP